MKRLTIILLVLMPQIGSAQNWQEWARQKKTQIKYLLQQIAANKVYIDYIEQGYRIAQGGLQTIRDIKTSDFHLHFNHFDSLTIVNPAVEGYARITDIIALQIRLVHKIAEGIEHVKKTGQLSASEKQYCINIYEYLLEECVTDRNDLFNVLTNGKFSMSDDERLKRIHAIYTKVQDKYGFTCSFTAQTGILCAQRLAEEVEIKYSRKLNGKE